MSEREEHLSSRDYARLCRLIQDVAGIRLGAEKKTMLESRIKRRLRALNSSSYTAYCDNLFRDGTSKDEIVHFIDVVTTNKTDFFREPAHFDFLMEKGLGEMAARCRGRRPLFIWSAGCSSGEEPYTLAMILSEFTAKQPGVSFNILATDISTAVLEKAVMGIYPGAIVEPVPAAMRRKYLMRSRNRQSDEVRVVPEVRRMIDFRRLNFMEEDYGIAEMADAIFCRNVLIYFDRPTQEQILRKLTRCLLPEGYLFIGHSESLHDMNLPLTPVAPALYRRIRDGA
jgi:chemotaxis protein methyltransferase CheR